ncbi:MAG: aspartate--tRNA ligase, partial [Bdellovibrionota bacterium]
MGGQKITRSHNCGELSASDLGKEVTLCGWVAKNRDHGGLVFADLRDRYGITQAVFDPALGQGGGAYELARSLRSEFVVWCRGKVRRRPEKMSNPNLATGEIEVACSELAILSEAKTPPFSIEDDIDVGETVRLKYRYLDLRRPSLQKNLIIRHKMLSIVRNHLDLHGFVEVETPILYKSTPEGARDFIVPSRLNPGTFYALPQSPQTLKQLLMISGMDRYYQIARCFRDEDLRADRQPEFSQIDIETSFMDEDAFFPIMEEMIRKLWKDILSQDVTAPFPRLSYAEAMERFGSDKPDVRFGLELCDLSDLFMESGFQVFKNALEQGSSGKHGQHMKRRGSVRAVVVPGEAEKFSRKDLDDLQSVAASFGAKGLLWIKVQAGGELQSPAAKFLRDQEKKGLVEKLSLKPGHLVLIVADAKDKVVFDSLGAIRLNVGSRLGLIPKLGQGKPAFLWVVNFPLLEFDDKENRYYACHHPFTSPRAEFMDDFVAG